MQRLVDRGPTAPARVPARQPRASLHALAPDALAQPSGLEERLERGEILYFPPGLLPLPRASDLAFLRSELEARVTLKNVSYHPAGDYLSGLEGDAGLRARTRAILAEFGRESAALLAALLPHYAPGWRTGKVNYRPFEEEGRDLAAHSSNELVHVDAFASGATHGGRILRFFTNVHPSAPRVWKSGGLFPQLLAEFGSRAGIAGLGARGLAEGPLDRAFSGLLRLAVRAGIPQAATLDTSPYDRAMKRLHDRLKDSPDFQADEGRLAVFEFPAASSWAVLTDMVSHAVVRGQHALVCTWIVPLESCRLRELAPYTLLAGSSRDALPRARTTNARA